MDVVQIHEVFQMIIHTSANPNFLLALLITTLAYVLDAHLFISMPADVPVPNGAGPSVGRVLTKMLHMFSLKFHWLSVIL